MSCNNFPNFVQRRAFTLNDNAFWAQRLASTANENGALALATLGTSSSIINVQVSRL